MRFALALTVVTLLSAGCGSAPPATAQEPVTPADFLRTATPFVVEGADGPLAMPFAGGFWAPVPQLIDLTGDGRPDFTVSSGGAGIGLYVNTESGWRWESGRLGDLTPGPWYRFGDLDGDGDADILTRGEPGQARYIENTGTPEAPVFVVRAEPLTTTAGKILQIEDTSVPTLGDVDGDGDLDILAGKADLGTITYYRLDRVDDGVPMYTLVTEEWQDIQIFESNPQCTDSGRGPGTSMGGRGSRHGANAIALADIQGSSAPELFWGDFFTERLFYYRNNGSPEVTELELLSESFPDGEGTPGGQNAATFADLDGDGDMDLVVGVLGGLCVTDQTPTHNIVRFTNTGSPEAPQFARETTRMIVSIDHGRRSVPAFTDIDGDGDLDMVIGDGNTSASLALYLNEGTSGATRFVLSDADWLNLEYDFGGYAPVFGDLDADGDPDLLVGGFNGRLAFLENVGSATAPSFEFREGRSYGIDAGQYAKPSLGDIDADGDLDLLIGESNGRVFLYRNVGTPEAPVFETEGNGTPSTADLAFREAAGILDDVGQESSPSFADLDMDGDLDILIGSSTGEIFLYLNTGTPASPQYVASGVINAERVTTTPRAVDLTGDGRPDIISGSDAGGLLFWTSSFGTANEPGAIGQRQIEAWPNPSDGAVSLSFGEQVRDDLVIRDTLGREVRRLSVTSESTQWDGRDASGAEAPSGVYLLRLSGGSETVQVTLAR